MSYTGNFITDYWRMSGSKSDLNPIVQGTDDPDKYVVATEWNASAHAAEHTRDWLISGSYFGFAHLTGGLGANQRPGISGSANFIFLSSSGEFCIHKSSGVDHKIVAYDGVNFYVTASNSASFVFNSGQLKIFDSSGIYFYTPTNQSLILYGDNGAQSISLLENGTIPVVVNNYDAVTFHSRAFIPSTNNGYWNGLPTHYWRALYSKEVLTDYVQGTGSLNLSASDGVKIKGFEIDTSAAADGRILRYDGTKFVAATLTGSGGSGVAEGDSPTWTGVHTFSNAVTASLGINTRILDAGPTTLIFSSSVPDGNSSVAFRFKTDNTFAAGTARIISVMNGETEHWWVDRQGYIRATNVTNGLSLHGGTGNMTLNNSTGATLSFGTPKVVVTSTNIKADASTGTLYLSGTNGVMVSGAIQSDALVLSGSSTGFITLQAGTINYKGGSIVRVTDVTTNYTASISDYIINYTTVNVFVTCTLPDNAPKGTVYIIKDVSGFCSASNPICVKATTDNIDGTGSYKINVPYGKMGFLSDGANWFTI